MTAIMSSIWCKINTTKQWPVIVSNKDFVLINESAYICNELENRGFKVETFANRETKEYGLKIYEK